MSVLTGKYRPRKEWSTSSIPELLSQVEETTSTKPDPMQSSVQIQVNGIPEKGGRRSSLAIGLLGGGGHKGPPNGISPEKHYKRRSSIAVAFLGRRDNTQKVELLLG